MRILIFTEKKDYVKVIGLLVDDIYKEIDVEMISECQLANVALSHPHDLIVIDDRLYNQLTIECIEVLEHSQMDIVVFLNKKENIKRYLNFNLLDYFVSPVKWHRVDIQLKQHLKRMVALNHLDDHGYVPNKYVLKHKSEIHIIDYDHIFFFEKDHKLVKIHTKSEIFETHDSLKHMCTILPESFIRVHSSYIVNFDNAESIIETENRSFSIQFKGYAHLAFMSRKKADDMMHDAINKYRLSYIKEQRKDQ